MKSTKWATSVLTAVALFNTAPLFAKNRCEADLGRVDTNFCLADRHSGVDQLNYGWQLKDTAFDLSSKACFADGATGARRDIVLAIDRSQNVWYADTSRGKFGSDNLSTARYIIQKLRDEARSTGAAGPKVSVVLFSSAPDCREWTGGPITVNREFPCMYVKAGSVADAAHVENLLGFLKAADKKYSQGSLPLTSDYGIVADLLSADTIAMNSAAQAGLMLFSDGRTYHGDNGDPFAYLRSGNYTRAQDEAIAKFGNAGMKKYKSVFALTPVQDPAFDQTHADAYDNMCTIGAARPEDCDKTKIKYADPKTWPVNRMNINAFATRLVSATSTVAKPVFIVTSSPDVEPALEELRNDGGYLPIEAVSYSIDGGASKAGSVEGGRIYLETLPAGSTIKLLLQIKANGSDLKIPMTVKTEALPYDGKEFTDKEMLCKVDGPAAETAGPKLNLNNLQGGSASCGVIGQGKSAGSAALLFLAPLAIAGLYFSSRRRSGMALVAVGLVGLTSLSQTTEAAESGGLNALQYRPVVDGIGTAEKATTLGAGSYNAGLFMDYANDSVELGGEKNKRLDSIMDDLVTAHAVANVGLHRRVSLGIHVPYVQKTDLDRAVGGEDVEGGQLGQPSDMSASLKINLMTRPTYALGLMPVATFATGNPDYLLGDGTNNFGALFLASGTQGAMTWAVNTGYVQREHALKLEDDRANAVTIRGQFMNYGGIEYRYSSLFSFGGNLQVKLTSGEHIDLTRSNPAEWTAMAKMRPLTGLEVQSGFGTGLGKGYGSPDYRVFAGVTYIPGADSIRSRSATSTAKWKAKTPAKKAVKTQSSAKRPLAKR